MTDAKRWAAARGKRPFQTNGRAASSTDSTTWAQFADVKGCNHGFMLGAGFACIDLDGCFRNGRLQAWARRIVDAVPDAFIERSISGNGLHIFGLLPEARGRKYGNVEIYSRARFIRTTADVWTPGELVALTPAVHVIQEMANAGKLAKKK